MIKRPARYLALMFATALAGCGGGNSGSSLDNVPDTFGFATIRHAVPDADYTFLTLLHGISPNVTPVASVHGDSCDSAMLVIGEPAGDGRRELRVTVRTPNAFHADLRCVIDVNGVNATLDITTGSNDFAWEVVPGALNFAWGTFEGVAQYRLVRVNAATGMNEVQALIDGNVGEYTLPIRAHLVDWINDRFFLEACTSTAGCESVRSIPQHQISSLGQALSVQAITYVKASMPVEDGLFGSAIALDGNTLAVGASGQDESVHIFRRAGHVWAVEAVLKSSNSEDDDQFGTSLALHGDTIAVGAIGEDSAATGVNGDQENNLASFSGAVYVFRRIGNNWIQDAYIKASNTGADDYFGISMALDDDVLAIGAIFEDSGATGVGGDQERDDVPDSGAVYIFRKSVNGWVQETYLKASSVGELHVFGGALSLSGDLLAAGARREGGGTAYVFRRTESGWTEEARLVASNPDAGDRFGSSLALAGNVLVVGAPLEDSAARGVNGNQLDDSAQDSGAVYVFRRNDSSWTQEAYVKASNADAGDRFGSAVALTDDLMAIGAQGESGAATGVGGTEDNNLAEGSGAAYVFRYDVATGWRQTTYLKAPEVDDDDQFGLVAASGEHIAVTAYLEDSQAAGINGNRNDDSLPQSGAVYIY